MRQPTTTPHLPCYQLLHLTAVLPAIAPHCRATSYYTSLLCYQLLHLIAVQSCSGCDCDMVACHAYANPRCCEHVCPGRLYLPRQCPWHSLCDAGSNAPALAGGVLHQRREFSVQIDLEACSSACACTVSTAQPALCTVLPVISVLIRSTILARKVGVHAHGHRCRDQ